jgi:hypothetical protein
VKRRTVSPPSRTEVPTPTDNASETTQRIVQAWQLECTRKVVHHPMACCKVAGYSGLLQCTEAWYAPDHGRHAAPIRMRHAYHPTAQHKLPLAARAKRTCSCSVFVTTLVASPCLLRPRLLLRNHWGTRRADARPNSSPALLVCGSASRLRIRILEQQALASAFDDECNKAKVRILWQEAVN